MTLKTEIATIANPTFSEVLHQYIGSFGEEVTYEQVCEIADGFEQMLERERQIHGLSVMRAAAGFVERLEGNPSDIAKQIRAQADKEADAAGLGHL